jgi:hypothetical protein
MNKTFKPSVLGNVHIWYFPHTYKLIIKRTPPNEDFIKKLKKIAIQIITFSAPNSIYVLYISF